MNNPNNFGRGRAPATVAAPVLQALTELRRATPHEVTAHLAGRFTFAQVKKALVNLKYRGEIDSTGVVRIKGKKGSFPATYWIPGYAPEEAEEIDDGVDLFAPNRYYPPRPQYASVWDYAKRQGEQAERRRISSVWDLGNSDNARRAA